jgi:hypothetical protein
MKAPLLQLKGLTPYIDLSIRGTIGTIHFPLLTIITHRGYRLIASSVLPITEYTLIYGSDDGGAT